MNPNPFSWTFRSQCLAGFAACAGLIAFAIYSQFAWGLEPCPLCIFQRIAFAALGLVFLLAGLHAPRAAGGRKAWGVAIFLAAAAGMALAGRHVWLQLNPPEIPGCLPPLEFMRETMSTTSLVRKVLVGTGDCSAVDWSFLGLSMPAWSLVWFALLGAGGLYAAFRARPRSWR